MRDRLIELLNKKYDHFCDQCGVNKDSHYTENLADYLLANGVIVQSPKFKIEPIKCTKGSGIKGHETYLCYESGAEMAAKINEIIEYINNNDLAYLKGGAE